MDRRLYFTHKCRTCNYMFVTERDLLLHEASHESPDFRCSACHEVFDDEAQLTSHAETGCQSPTDDAGPKQHRVCKACGDVFDKVNDLYKHYVEQHLERDAGDSDASSKCRSSNTPTCAACGSTFACWASLKVHVWRMHGVNMAQKLPNFGPAAAASGVAADESAAKSRRLMASSRNVVADKPYKCTMCNWAFKYDFSLHSHMKVHEEKRLELIKLLQAGRITHPVVGASEPPGDDGAAAGSASLPPQPVKKTMIYVQVKREFPKDHDAEEDRQSSSDDAEGATGAKRIRVVTGLRTAVISNREQRPVSHNTFELSLENLVNAPQSSDSVNVPVAITDCGDSQVGASTEQSDAGFGDANLVDCTADGSLTRAVSSDDEDEPRHFVCKLCNFTCRYDFSYFAHLSQHEKLKELDIADLQAHLVASAAGVDGTAPDVAGNTNVGECSSMFGRPVMISRPGAADPSGDTHNREC